MATVPKKRFASTPEIEVVSDTPQWFSLRIQPTHEALEAVDTYFQQHPAFVKREIGDSLLIALHELLENAMEHGCRFECSKTIELTFIQTDQFMLFQIRDPGAGFSPENLHHTALANPPDAPLHHMEYRSQQGMRAGGYGILVARHIADEVIYSERGNEVMLIKYLR